MKTITILMVSLCLCLPAVLTAQPLFTASNPTCGGSSAISVPPNTFDSYSWNMGNGVTGTDFLPPTTTYNNTINTYTIQRTVSASNPFKVITAISVIHTGSFQDCAFEDSHPDYYLVIKNSSGTTLYITPINNNMDAPSTFNLSGILASTALLITVMDYDPSSFCANDNLGTVSLPADPSSGTYQTSNYSVIISITTQLVTTLSHTQTITVMPILMDISETCANDGLSAVLSSDLIGSSYYWSNGANTASISVNTGGTYSVTVTTTGGCWATAGKTINFSEQPIVACNGIMLTCTNYTSSIRWRNSSGTIVSNTATFTPTTSGTYYAEYWAGSCPVTSLGISYPNCTTIPTGIEDENIDNEKLTEFTAYPNPSTTGIFAFKLPNNIPTTDIMIEVFDITGKAILPMRSFDNYLDLSQYSNGVYIARYYYDDKTSTQKLVVAK